RIPDTHNGQKEVQAIQDGAGSSAGPSQNPSGPLQMAQPSLRIRVGETADRYSNRQRYNPAWGRAGTGSRHDRIGLGKGFAQIPGKARILFALPWIKRDLSNPPTLFS